jgi:hypothetical protein
VQHQSRFMQTCPHGVHRHGKSSRMHKHYYFDPISCLRAAKAITSAASIAKGSMDKPLLQSVVPRSTTTRTALQVVPSRTPS